MTQRITVSLSDETHRLVKEVTRLRGAPVSTWVDRVLRQEAVRQGAAPVQPPHDEVAAQALADLDIAAAAEAAIAAASYGPPSSDPTHRDQPQRRAG